MLMSCARLPWLLLLFLVAAGSQQYGFAEVAVVSTSAQLRAALSDAAVETVVLAGQVLLDPASFPPISLARPVVIASDGAPKALSFGSADNVLITVLPGGNLTLQGLILRDFYAVEPISVTSASSVMPISAVALSSRSADLVISSCILLVEGQLSAATGPMPFWSAQLPNMLDAVPTGQAGQQQPMGPISARITYFGGNSSVHILESKLVVTPSDCYSAAGAMVWDSYSLWSALQDSKTERVVLISSITLSPQHFSPFSSRSISSVTLSSCSSTVVMTLDFNSLHSALVMSKDTTLQLKDGLRLVGAANLSDERSAALLLLGSIDISSGARLVLQNVTVGVSNSGDVQQAAQQLAQDIGSPAATLQQMSAADGRQDAMLVVQDWEVNLEGTDYFGDATTAPAGTMLSMNRVTVVQAAQLCFPAGSPAATAADDMELQALLSNPAVLQIELVGNMTLQAARWQAVGADSASLIEIDRPLELRVCHPDAAAGARFVLDLSKLQGDPILNVTSMLRVTGDLEIRGVPDRAGVPGSWVVLPVVNLAGDEAALVFQDVTIVGRSSASFNMLKSSTRYALGRNSLTLVNSSMMILQQVKLPQYMAGQLFPGLSVSSSSGQSSSGRLLMSSSPASSSEGDRSFYGYLRTGLTCDPTIPTAAGAATAGKSLNTAALVLGILLGIVLLGVIGFLLAYTRILSARQRSNGICFGVGKLAICRCCGVPPPSKHPAWHQMNGAARRDLHVDAAESAAVCIGGTDSRGIDEGNDVALLGSLGGFDTSGTLCRIGSADNSRHEPVHAARGMQGPQSLTGAADQSHKAGQQFFATADVEHHERTASGAFEGEKITSSRVVNFGGHIVGGMSDANTTMTEDGAAGVGGAAAAAGGGQHKQQVFEDARKRLGTTAGDLARSDALVLEAVLGEGTFGKVFKGYWKGTLVAVKTMMFPAGMSGKEKREKMAIMETAISASLSHPNIVQMYTYYLRPVLVGHEAQLTGQAGGGEGHKLDSSSVGDSTMNAAFLNEGLSSSVHSWEVQLVLEYCDQGSLRSLLNKKESMTLPDGSKDMLLIVDTALDVARAMVHLHSENIIHSDLKARNILLKSSGGADGRPFVAKVADFGLSMRIDPSATHVSNVFQGTMTHMAPEVMLQGKLSRNSDVYAFGILLWELYSGGHAFKGIPRALLGHEVAHNQRRPQFPEGSPFEYQLLACRCWESDASIRPSFQEILAELQRLRERLLAAAASSSATLSSERVSNMTLASSQPATSNRPLPQPQQQQPAAFVSALPAAVKSSEGARSQQQQQQQILGELDDQTERHQDAAAAAAAPQVLDVVAPVSAAANATAAAAAAASGSITSNTGSAGCKVTGDLQGATVMANQQFTTGAGAASDNPIAEPLDADAGGHAAAGLQQQQQQQQQWLPLTAPSHAAEGHHYHHHQQQQQQQVMPHQGQHHSKEHIPGHLLQQMSISIDSADMLRLGESSDHVKIHGVAGHRYIPDFHPDRKLPTIDDSYVVQQQQQQQQQRQHDHGSISSGGDFKSMYVDETYDSTSNAHPRCVLYGAAMHLQPKGLFTAGSDSGAATGGDSATEAAAVADDTCAVPAASNVRVSGGEQGPARAIAPVPGQQQQQQQQSLPHSNSSARADTADKGGVATSASVKPMQQSTALGQVSCSAAPAAAAAAAVLPASHAAAVSEPLLACAAADQVQMIPNSMLSEAVPEISIPAAAAAAAAEKQQRSGSINVQAGRRSGMNSGRPSTESASSSRRSIELACRAVEAAEQQQQQVSGGMALRGRYPGQQSDTAKQQSKIPFQHYSASYALQASRQPSHQLYMHHDTAAAALQHRPPQQVRFSFDQQPEMDNNLQRRQQQQSPLLHSRSASVPSMSCPDGSSSSSSSGMEPTSDSSASRSRAAHSGSAAAMAAVLSLKAALAKRAMAERPVTAAAAGPSRQVEANPAAAAAGSSRAGQQVVSAAAAAPLQDSRSGPLLQSRGLLAAEQAADAAKLLQQQQQLLSQPLPSASLRPVAAVHQFSSFTAKRPVPESPQAPAPAAAAAPFAVSAIEGNTSQRHLQSAAEANNAAAAAAGRFSLDARAYTALAAAATAAARDSYHRPMPRAVATAWGVVTGRSSAPGSRPNESAAAAAAAAAANAPSGAVHPTSVSPVPGAKKFSLHRMVRKAVSARELGSSGTGAAAAAGGGGGSSTSRTPSDPPGTRVAASTAAAATGVGPQQELQAEQQHAGVPQQQQQQQVEWLQQATAGSSSQPPPALAALAPDQLQMLAEIADAAKAQVAVPFMRIPRAATAGAGSSSSSSHSAAGQQLLPSRSVSTGFIGSSTAAAAGGGGLSPPHAGLLTRFSLSDLNSQPGQQQQQQQQQQEQIPSLRPWGGYPPGTDSKHSNALNQLSSDLGLAINQSQAAAAAAATATAGRFSLDTRRNQVAATTAAAAAAAPTVRSSVSGPNVLRFANPQRPPAANPMSRQQQQQQQQQQQGFANTSPPGLVNYNSRPGLHSPSSGGKPRRASAPLQQPADWQKEAQGPVLSSVTDGSGTSYGSTAAAAAGAGAGAGRFRRASAPPQQQVILIQDMTHDP